jgi:transposase
MKQGQQKIVPALQPGTKKHRHILGAYSWHTDTISWNVTSWKNSQSFLAFIEYLLVDCYPTGRIVLVMDNVSYHKSAAVLAALSLFEHRLLVIWLPPYCPELNLIERYWKHLKDLTCANKLHNSIEEVVASAEYFLSQQNHPASNLRLTFSKIL